MAQELLDSEAPILSNYEKALNYLEAIPLYVKVFFIALFSFFMTYMIPPEGNLTKYSIGRIISLSGGLFGFFVAGSFFFQLCLTIGCNLVDIITGSMPKIKVLGLWSITLLFSLFSLITSLIWKIFIA